MLEKARLCTLLFLTTNDPKPHTQPRKVTFLKQS